MGELNIPWLKKTENNLYKIQKWVLDENVFYVCVARLGGFPPSWTTFYLMKPNVIWVHYVAFYVSEDF